MEHYRNLIKRKEYKIIKSCIICIILGIFALWCCRYDIAIGLFFGIYFIYQGLIGIPITTPHSQNDEDYIVKIIDKNVYIKYKEYEFLVEKEIFETISLPFKDKNGKVVCGIKSSKIHNYAVYKYNKLIEENINVIKEDEITEKFQSIRLMNNEEREWYINYKKLKNRKKIISFLISIFLYGYSIFCFLVGLLNFANDFKLAIVIVIYSIILFLIGKFCYKLSIRHQVLIKKIVDGKIYIADCYSFNKKIIDGEDGKYYKIKVADSQGKCINKWFEIPKDIYINNDIVKAKLVVLEDNLEVIVDK